MVPFCFWGDFGINLVCVNLTGAKNGISLSCGQGFVKVMCRYVGSVCVWGGGGGRRNDN